MSALVTSPFLQRHVGPSDAEQQRMLTVLGYADMAAFLADVVPEDILDEFAPQGVLPPGCGEAEALAHLSEIAAANDSRRSLIGLGYYGTATPALIQRHVFENPAWYTAYTPYQAEIAQGTPRGPVEFPDPDQRADRSAHR